MDSTESEIITDIESRIAEIFSQKINSAAQVIDITMVQNVITTIGAPHYFGTAHEQQRPPINSRPIPAPRRLMRDGTHRFFGGVCAGLASYFGTDITLMRVVALILFFCAGFGLIPYIILWIIIPKASTSEELEMVQRGYNN